MTNTFKIGGELEIHRLGFGAMRLTGKGVWGEPLDRAEALRTLRRVPELGIDFIDTADSYGPDISEQLIKEALHPYVNVHVATKGGLTRTGPDQWFPVGRPEYLLQQVHKSLRALGVERLELWQLHRIDAKVPRKEQFDAIQEMIDKGLIRFAGLSEVSVEEIKAAQKHFKVATVQNKYNLADRSSEPVLEYCEKNGIGFIPWFPLAAGELSKSGGKLDTIAKAHGVGPSQIAVAWLLRRSSVMIPIPGTSKVSHLEENVTAAKVELSDAQFTELSKLGK